MSRPAEVTLKVYYAGDYGLEYRLKNDQLEMWKLFDRAWVPVARETDFEIEIKKVLSTINGKRS